MVNKLAPSDDLLLFSGAVAVASEDRTIPELLAGLFEHVDEYLVIDVELAALPAHADGRPAKRGVLYYPTSVAGSADIALPCWSDCVPTPPPPPTQMARVVIPVTKINPQDVVANAEWAIQAEAGAAPFGPLRVFHDVASAQQQRFPSGTVLFVFEIRSAGVWRKGAAWVGTPVAIGHKYLTIPSARNGEAQDGMAELARVSA